MKLYLALVHYPVYNKKKEIVTTSITTLDIHDISRLSKTYGIEKFFLVTPLDTQIKLVQRMLTHWTDGYGATYNPTRKEALAQTMIVKDISSAQETIEQESGKKPAIVVTCARENHSTTTFSEMREYLKGSESCLLLLGTGWGLIDEVLMSADFVLEPIKGKSNFNHLPVRAAAAVILDRLLR